VAVTDDDLDRLEQTFDCRLPADYRLFMKTFGPGNLNGYLAILSPDRVIDETSEMRAIYKEDGEDPANLSGLFFFDCFDNAVEHFQPSDIDRFICIASSGIGDTHYILPGDPPRYFEAPRDGFEVAIVGSTLDAWLEYLDPRTRYIPQARRVVEAGMVWEDDGRPDGSPVIHTFTPEGYPPIDPRPWNDYAVVWGHADDRLVSWSGWSYGRRMEPTLELIHDDMARYPLLALLDTIAQHDPTTRFIMKAKDSPETTLEVPQYEATLRAGGGQHGLTLYVHVPQVHARELFYWLVQALSTAGAEIPQELRTLAAE
jgi:hypothetical protein